MMNDLSLRDKIYGIRRMIYARRWRAYDIFSPSENMVVAHFHNETPPSCDPHKISRADLRFLDPAPPVERVTGIEPANPAWEAGVLPLDYTRKITCPNKAYYTPPTTICQEVSAIKCKLFFVGGERLGGTS